MTREGVSGSEAQIPATDLDPSLVCQKALLLSSGRLGWHSGSQREAWVKDGVIAAKSCSVSQKEVVTLMKLFPCPWCLLPGSGLLL